MKIKLTGADWAAATLVVAALVYAACKPIWDWDVIPYLFLAKQALGAGVLEAHTWVYAQIDTLPEVWRSDLLMREDFRKVVAADPTALEQVSAFYRQRVGYYGLIALLVGLGVPAIWAVQALGLAAMSVSGAVVWAWARRLCPLWGALVLLAGVLIFPSVMKVARWSNPDGMITACYLVGVYALLQGREKDNWWFAAWLMMVMLRPNCALWLAPLCALWVVQRDWQRAWMLGFVGAVAVTLHGVYADYGLMVGWRQAFEGAEAYPARLHIPFSWDYYLHWLQERMLGLHGRDLLLFMLMWLAVGVVGARGDQRLTLLTGALVSGILLQVLAFPGFWERLYVGPVLAVVLLAASCVTGVFCAKAYKIGNQEK